jgi:hypothetical protein
MLTGGNARSASLVHIDRAPDRDNAEHDSGEDAARIWTVRQVIDDPAGDHDWGIDAVVDLTASAAAGVAVVRVLGLRRL